MENIASINYEPDWIKSYEYLVSVGQILDGKFTSSASFNWMFQPVDLFLTRGYPGDSEKVKLSKDVAETVVE